MAAEDVTVSVKNHVRLLLSYSTSSTMWQRRFQRVGLYIKRIQFVYMKYCLHPMQFVAFFVQFYAFRCVLDVICYNGTPMLRMWYQVYMAWIVWKTTPLEGYITAPFSIFGWRSNEFYNNLQSKFAVILYFVYTRIYFHILNVKSW